MPRSTAFVRSVPLSFASALTSAAPPHVIDVPRARRQHDAYAAQLRAGGFSVDMIESSDDHPDGPFIEDPAVLIGDTLVLTRPGPYVRRGEVDGLEAALAGSFSVRRIVAPGTLEGGDVLRVGDRLYVGHSTRTNDEGICQLTEIAADEHMEVVTVPVSAALHLKTVITALDQSTLVGAAGHVDERLFAGLSVLWFEDIGEANVLALPDKTVLVPASQPRLVQAISSAGFSVVTVDVSEFEKADGGLTCLSLRAGVPVS